MAYDSYYRRSEEAADMAEVNPKNVKEKKVATVGLFGPMGFWVGLLVLAALIQLLAIPFATGYGHTEFNPYLNDFASYVLYLPGIIALPLIISLWIGDRVSGIANSKSTVAEKGFVNAVYCVLIYAVSIFIIYLVLGMQKLAPLGVMSTTMFVEYMIGVPAVITLVIVPLFAVLSSARKYV